MKYLIIEPTGTGFSACFPDLPGCVSTGTTREEVERNMREAIELHLEGLHEERYSVPEPSTSLAYIKMTAQTVLELDERGGGAALRFLRRRNA